MKKISAIVGIGMLITAAVIVAGMAVADVYRAEDLHHAAQLRTAYLAWCKLVRRDDITYTEWNVLRKYELLNRIPAAK